MYGEIRTEDETVLVKLTGAPASGELLRTGQAHWFVVLTNDGRELGRGLVGDRYTVKRGMVAIDLESRNLDIVHQVFLGRSIPEALELLELSRVRGVLRCDDGTEIPGTLVSGPPNRANFIFDAIPAWTQGEDLLK